MLKITKLNYGKIIWWPIWNELNHDPLVLPLGDLEDIQNLKPEDLAEHRLTGLTKIAERYSANNIILLQAQYNETSQSLDVMLEKIKGKQKTIINYEYPGGPNIQEQDLYQAAAEDIAYRLQNDKLTAENLTTTLESIEPPIQEHRPAPSEPEQQNITTPEPYSLNAPGVGYLGQKRAIEPPPVINPPASPAPAPVVEVIKKPTAAAPVAKSNQNVSEAVVAAPDLLTWQRIRGKIMSIPGVTLKIKSLNSGRAYITLSYNNDIESLKKSLSDKGLMAASSGTNLAIKEK